MNTVKFELVFAACVMFILILMYLFYVKYPTDLMMIEDVAFNPRRV